MTERCDELASSEVGWTVQNELAQLEQAYESGDVLGVPAHCLIGTEIDFRVYENESTADQIAALEASRESIISDLSLLVPKDEAQAQRKADWLQQIPHLTHAELINYHIYRRLSVPTLDTPHTAMYLRAYDSPEMTLEFVFGYGLYQTGYYDNPSNFEMRTQAAKPTIAMERIRRAVTVAKETCRSFGFSFYYRGDQTNFSVWTPDKEGRLQPMHSLYSPEGQEVARKATAGMLYALRDSIPALQPGSISSLPHSRELRIRAAPEREGALRVVPDRFEQRRRVGADNHALGALILMSGFAHGLTSPELETDLVRKEQRDLLMPGEGYDKVRDLYLLRALQQSMLGNGRFVFGGTHALEIERTEGMLSSIIGTQAQEFGNGSYVITKLLGCISVDAEGKLVADEHDFNAVLQDTKQFISLIGEPEETINDRLKRIRRVPDCATIIGAIDAKWSSGVTRHADLREFAQAASLKHISGSTREAIRMERAAAFTHDAAVAEYCFTTIAQTLSPAEEKVALLRETITQFPEADSSKVISVFRERLDSIAASRAKLVAKYEMRAAEASSVNDQEEWEWEQAQKEYEQFSALRQRLQSEGL